MPEGCELRHSRDVIRGIILGAHLTEITIVAPSRFSKKPPEGLQRVSHLLPLLVEGVHTKGKFMWWELRCSSTGELWYLWCTYGMSGQWGTSAGKHTGVTISYTTPDGRSGNLHFNDPRHFGTLKFVGSDSVHRRKLATLGPDMLEDAQVSPEIFAGRLAGKPTMEIGDALLDQSLVSGVGNYIRAEALFRAGVSPFRKISTLKTGEYLKLFEATRSVMKESYECHGATIHTYRTVGGELGQQQFKFRVYDQRNCPIGHGIRRETMPGGRTIHWCNECQG